MDDALATYLRAGEAVREELDAPLRVAEGALPPALRGVLYRNGPGKMDVFGTRYGHPFDGDGMVTRFAFDGSGVRYRNRFVRTAELVAEERAGRMLYRSFGTNVPGGLRRNFLRLHFKNAANTSVVLHGGRLLALWEGGLPHRLDPETLETKGRFDFAGQLRNRTSLLGRLVAPELPFSAHPKRDVATGDLHNFGTLLGEKNQLVHYRVRPDGTMDAPSFTPLGALSFVHDFVLTRRYAAFFLSSVSFRVLPTLFGLATPVGSLRPSDRPAAILLVPREGGPALTVPVSAGFLFHFVNGFDEDDGRVVLDGMRLQALMPAASFQALLDGERVDAPPPQPTRYVLDVARRTATQSPLTETPAELPTIHPRRAGLPYRHFWALAGQKGQTDPFFRRLLHANGSGGEAVRDFAPDLPGEPLFVPAGDPANEAQGFVLCLVYRADAHRSDLYVLDPDDLRTVCRLELPHHVPPGFHGTWAEAGVDGRRVIPVDEQHPPSAVLRDPS
jgi:all-trans-8'-apo-beta-carotenal 15,15'-oxygenase